MVRCETGTLAQRLLSRPSVVLQKSCLFVSFSYSSELWGILKLHTAIQPMNTLIT